ncbi:MAG: carbohydrate binding domain-containing protein [Flavobacteriia bacterium]|nr:carbohydrate binding domain-containing protein [Flavobacteriia bacterium]
MKKKRNFLLYFFLLLTQFACEKKDISFFYANKAAGFNGSFEFTKKNLPINWILYTPKTVPSSDFDLYSNDKDFINGKRSLHFKVRKCKSTGGWLSPGLSKEIHAKPGEIYKVSFWLKNNKSKFIVKAGGTSEFDGKMDILVTSNMKIDKWKKFEYLCTIPNKMNKFRLEINVLQPGEFLIDNVVVEKIKK